jgi:hypothetical protein
METDVISVVALVLGVVGALGVTLVPMRAWQLVVKRRLYAASLSQRQNVALFFFPALALLFAVWLGCNALPRVYGCLLDSTHCSGNRSGGLIRLAEFGVGVACLEVCWWASSFFRRRLVSHAA